MLEALFQNSSQQVLSKYKPQITQINAFETKFKNFTDSELREKTKDLKQRLLKGEPQSSLIPESFALVREASTRVLGLRHYDVQLVGGLVLNEGKIAEMKTGEGKTLAATIPIQFITISISKFFTHSQNSANPLSVRARDDVREKRGYLFKSHNFAHL